MTDRHEPDSLQRSLWDSLPEREFIVISDLRSFKLRDTTVLLKIKSSVRGIPLTQTEPLGEMPFGSVVAIACADIVIAYQIVMPPCKLIDVRANYAAFARKNPSFNEVNRYVADKHIGVVGNESALLCVTDRILWTKRST